MWVKTRSCSTALAAVILIGTSISVQAVETETKDKVPAAKVAAEKVEERPIGILGMIREANARKEAERAAAPDAKAESDAKAERAAEPAPKAKAAKAKRRTTKAADAAAVETTGSIAPQQRTARSEHRGKSYIKSLIRKHAIEKGVPVEFAEAVVMVESNFNPKARSPAGAVGLMQIIPSTARGLGYRGSTAGLYDLETNIHWGMTYLAGAYDRAGGDTCGAVLRYNAGHFATRMTRGVRAYCAKVNRYVAAL